MFEALARDDFQGACAKDGTADLWHVLITIYSLSGVCSLFWGFLQTYKQFWGSEKIT